MNIGPSSCYMFLFDKPITYTRPLIFGERITDVKLLVVFYNEAVAHCSVRLYRDHEMVDWDEVLTKKDDSNLIYDDTFLLENTKLERFFGKILFVVNKVKESKKENVTWEDLREAKRRAL